MIELYKICTDFKKKSCKKLYFKNQNYSVDTIHFSNELILKGHFSVSGDIKVAIILYLQVKTISIKARSAD